MLPFLENENSLSTMVTKTELFSQSVLPSQIFLTFLYLKMACEKCAKRKHFDIGSCNLIFSCVQTFIKYVSDYVKMMYGKFT